MRVPAPREGFRGEGVAGNASLICVGEVRFIWRRRVGRESGDCVALRAQRREPPGVVRREKWGRRHRFQIHLTRGRQSEKIDKDKKVELGIRQRRSAWEVRFQKTPRVGERRRRSAARRWVI